MRRWGLRDKILRDKKEERLTWLFESVIIYTQSRKHLPVEIHEKASFGRKAKHENGLKIVTEKNCRCLKDYEKAAAAVFFRTRFFFA